MAGKKKSKKSKNGKKPQGSKQPKPAQLSQRLEQETSPLFNLIPQEIRDQIYGQVFVNTRLTWGERSTGRIGAIRIKPPPNALALLRTCQRIRDEIGDTWLGKVLFSFEDVEAMLDKLSALPVTTVSKLRYMRVVGKTLMLSWPEDDVYYRLSAALKLIPSLRLDTLTVLGSQTGWQVQYDTINKLIRYSSGWKELRYICNSSKILGYAEEPTMWGPIRDIYVRKPQPSDWQGAMNDRDGDCRPSVTIYRSKTVAVHPSDGLMTNPSNWERYEQKIPTTREDRLKFGLVEDAKLMTKDEQDKEVLIIVKRGEGVDYEEKKNAPLIPGDIRIDLPGKSWKQIRAEHIDNMPSDCDDYPFGSDSEDERSDGVADSYDNVDEYSWRPLDYRDDC